MRIKSLLFISIVLVVSVYAEENHPMGNTNGGMIKQENEQTGNI